VTARNRRDFRRNAVAKVVAGSTGGEQETSATEPALTTRIGRGGVLPIKASPLCQMILLK
jgi:hypothetical protein